MLGKTYDTQICSIARALEDVGERWSLLILRDAIFTGATRFGDFQHNLGVATNVLTTRLDGFVASGIMEDDGVGGYALTAKGRALALALIALTEWGDEWASPVEPPILYRHAECSGDVHAAAVCEACGEVSTDEVGIRLGPGMPAEYVATRRGPITVAEHGRESVAIMEAARVRRRLAALGDAEATRAVERARDAIQAGEPTVPLEEFAHELGIELG